MRRKPIRAMRTKPSRPLLLLIALATPLAPRAAIAAPDGKDSPAGEAPRPSEAGPEDKKTEARVRFERGMALFDRKVWDGALAEFLASRDLFRTRSNTQNAAICLRNLDRFDEALELFESMITDFPQMSAEDRAGVDKEVRELRALVGVIELANPTPGAQVVVDGRERGETPLASPLRVSVGARLVRIYKKGFLPAERRVTIAGGQLARIDAKLEPLAQSGDLTVAEATGKPATLIVDGIPVGPTPFKGPVSPGEHTVLLKGEGSLGTQPATAVVRANQATSLRLSLEPLEGELRVEPVPVNATVAIDGVTVGSGVWDGRLRVGNHRVEVGLQGFLAQSRTIPLTKGRGERVTIQLERDPDSALWAGEKPRGKVFVELTPGWTFGLVNGTDCGSCEASLASGPSGLFHGGYQLPQGLGFGLDVGATSIRRTVSDRPLSAVPVGKPEVFGKARDELALRGLLLGLSGSFSIGETWPILLRVGAGAFLGAVTDTRTASFAPTGGAPFDLSLEQGLDARYLYVAPEARVGRRFGKSFVVSLGLDARVMIALTQPVWDRTPQFNVAGLGLVRTGAEEPLFGRTLIGLTPSLAARLEL